MSLPSKMSLPIKVPLPIKTSLPVDTALMARTAEMLALPHQACFRRVCRRMSACSFWFKDNGEPCCLLNLTETERACFDELYDQALRIGEHGGRQGLMYAGLDPVRRALQDAGVEIVRAAVPPRDKRRFDAFRRDRERMPAPDPMPPASRHPK